MEKINLMFLIKEQKEREFKEKWEDTRKDILANVLKIRKDFIEKNYSEKKIDMNTLYFLLDVDINFLLEKKWFSDERKSQYVYERANELGLTKEEINLKGINNKYSVKELNLYDYENQKYTNSAEEFIKKNLNFDEFYNDELLSKLQVTDNKMIVENLLEVMNKLIKELETGTYEGQYNLVKEIYIKFKKDIDNETKIKSKNYLEENFNIMKAKFRTKTFLEKNYYAISENLIKKIVEENRLFRW